MTRPFSSNREKRFSIDDAFEEETDEAIKVYGATTDLSPIKAKFKDSDHACRTYTNKCTEDTTSRDSDSLIHDYVIPQTTETYCWRHPKVRENWRTVLFVILLLVFGCLLFGMATVAFATPDGHMRAIVFLIAGLICFVPGAYHLVYIWLAARGQSGYNFYNLPIFSSLP